LAEPLRNRYGAEIPRRIAAMVAKVHPAFASKAFVADALDGYEALDLMARGRKIAAALRCHLPPDYREAVKILVESMDSPLEGSGGEGMAAFLYLPHSFFVADNGLDHFDESMAALHAITQRFTSEFAIRPFLERHPQATLAQLHRWTRDPSVHVRRLVSEGTRPRLPWAPRLRVFQKDPRPVLALLELLKDDPELYVRRSVANSLNDIGKDHPEIVVEVAKRWLEGAGENRRWVVRHALRSAVKRGEPGALAVLGFGGAAKVEIRNVSITPKRVASGKAVTIAFDVENSRSKPQRVLVDFRIHFVKARGEARPKVFKMKSLELAARESVRVTKKVSLAAMTTRTHHPGKHAVDALVNGEARPLGAFTLI
jgi:3-methyladenine DNA glycosylase AlkC